MSKRAEIEAKKAAFKADLARKVHLWRNSQHPKITLAAIAAATGDSLQYASRALAHPDQMSDQFVFRLSAGIQEFRSAYTELKRIVDDGLARSSAPESTPPETKVRMLELINQMKGLLDELARSL